MKCKKAMALMLCIALLAVCTACGEKTDQGKKDDVIRIGVMQFGEFTALQNVYDGFVEGLKERGYEDGKNIKLIYLSAAADTANCPTIADTLINDGSDLIFAIATPSVSCIKEKTTSIPILFSAVTDPVQSGLVADSTVPGGNISGTSDMNPVAEQISLLHELVPQAQSVAVLYCSSESNSAVQYELAKKQIEALHMTCVQKTIADANEIKSAVESLQGVVDGIYIPTDNTLAESMTSVAQVANDCKLPVIVGEPGMVQSGGTATYGINYVELGKQTAAMAVQVLQSDDPLKTIASMPIGYQSEGCITAINQASVEACGITVPQSVSAVAEVY